MVIYLCVRGICVRGIYVRGICVRGIYVRGIYFSSFHNLFLLCFETVLIVFFLGVFHLKKRR